MGYRNYFYVAEKKKVDDFLALSHEEQMKVTAEVIKKDYNDQAFAQEQIEEYLKYNQLCRWETMDYLEAKEIHGCGKYFDDNVQKEIVKDSVDLSGNEDEFYLNVKPEALIICAEHYKDKSVKYWSTIIKSEANIDDIKNQLQNHVRDLNYVLNTDPNNKFSITNSWDYEYAMLELVHLYKLIDWNKYSLIWCGY